MFSKKNQLLIGGLILLIIILLFIEFLLPKTAEEDIAKIVDRPTSQTPLPEPSTNLPPFNLVSKPLVNSKMGPADQLNFSFSSPIAVQEIKYLITPPIQMDASVSADGTVLILEPTQTWELATKYKLTLYKSLSSLNGQTLSEDINLEFETVPYSGY